MLQNAYLLAKIGADTAENERDFAEILPKTGNLPFAASLSSFPQYTESRRRLRAGAMDRNHPAVLASGTWGHWTATDLKAFYKDLEGSPSDLRS